MPRFRTLKEIDRAGLDIRLWCFRCTRGAVLDGSFYLHFEQRGLPTQLAFVQRKFPCRQCGARDCLIIPATAHGPRPKDATGWAVTWFFANRKAAKQQRRR